MTLFEMLNGRIVWEEMDFQTVERRLQQGHRSVTNAALAFQPHVPERLRRAVRKALRRDPTTRFGSHEEFIRELRKVVSVDWRHSVGNGIEGEWYGTWPPQLRADLRLEYRVEAKALRAGPNTGRLRMESDYRRPGANAWRQAAPDRTIDADDTAAASEYFEQVAANAAHRSPAR
jgi:hypothetical protein